MSSLTEMQRKTAYGVLGLLAIVALVAQWLSAAWFGANDIVSIPIRTPVAGASLCPWRQPEADMSTFFPHATSHRTESIALSHHLAELRKRLGRWPGPAENPLQIHRIYAGRQLLGSVLARRVKGEYGAIEIVLAVNTQGRVRDLKMQRLREPTPIAGVLRSPQWLHAFEGKTVESDWRLGHSIPDVPAAARPSAEAVVSGVRSLLILLDAAGRTGTGATVHHH
jgi:hypothetical protein